jgi:hypothetical protein
MECFLASDTPHRIHALVVEQLRSGRDLLNQFLVMRSFRDYFEVAGNIGLHLLTLPHDTAIPTNTGRNSLRSKDYSTSYLLVGTALVL